MRRLLEETMSQDDSDPFTYKIFRTKDMASRPGKIYSIRVLDDENEYGWIKMQATRGVDVESLLDLLGNRLPLYLYLKAMFLLMW